MNEKNELSHYSERDGIAPRVYNRDEHSLSRKDIDPDALKIMRRLNRYGHKAFLVGGGVRDILLNKEPKDFDIATSAHPEQIRALFRNSRIIGRRFKLAHIYFKNNKIIEVSTFRDNELPEDEENIDIIRRDNTYGDELSDAFRRDLTINGLFYDLHSFSIVDYVGGMEDLEAGLVRIIGDPQIRFSEDPIRILRTIRHKVRTDFEIDSDAQQAIRDKAELLRESSPARLYDELKKDLCSSHAFRFVTELFRYELFHLLFPAFEQSSSKTWDTSNGAASAFEQLRQLFARQETTAFMLLFLALIDQYQTFPLTDPEDFKDRKEELKELIQAAYTDIMVPKKDYEKMFLIIDRVARILNSGKLVYEKVRNQRFAAETVGLVWILNPELASKEEFEDALAIDPSEQGRQTNRRTRKPGRSQPRGRRRRSRRSGS